MITTYLNHLRLFNRNVWLLLITAALTGFSYIGIYIILFNLYLLRLGFGPEFIGTINAAAQLGFALFSLPAGALGQRWGNRKMTILGLFIGAVAFALLPLAEFLPTTWQAGWLTATYVLAWLAGALYLVNSYPFLVACTGSLERSHVFSVRQALLPLGTFAGSLSGGLLPELLVAWSSMSLEQAAPYRYVLLVGAGVLLIGVLGLLTTSEVSFEQRQERAAPDDSLPGGLIAFMAAVTFFFAAGYNTAGTFASVYMDESLQLSTASIGVLMAVSQLLGVLVALIMPLVAARWGKVGSINYGLLLLAVSLLLPAFMPNLAAAGSGFTGAYLAFALISPTLTLCQLEIVPPGWRATMSGAAVMAQGLGKAVIAFGGGYLITAFGYPSLFLTGALLAALGAGLMWAYSWAPRWLITRRAVANVN